METKKLKRLWVMAGFCIGLSPLLAHADDTDIYLDPQVPSSAEPLVMFTLDYRPNLGSTVCTSGECDQLIAEGYLPSTGPYTFFDVLRAVFKRVFDPLDGVKIGFMMNHANSCGGGTSGPFVTGCSNGGYVLNGYTAMSAGTDDGDTFQITGEDPNKIALYNKLDGIPTPSGGLSHSLQGKELYFELFRYLTGQRIYNGHVGYEDFGDTDGTTNLDVDLPGAAWDTGIESGSKYKSPLVSGGECARMFVVNLMFQVSNQEDDSDLAILESKGNGGMGGINLSGTNNEFDTVIRYLRDADLGDGTFGAVSDLEGNQNVVSYFLVDPTKINQTTSGYAEAGGTGVPLPLSQDPEELTTTLENIFRSILSVSATFVAPSVPVNVFNRAQTVDEVYLALFDADEDGFPRWEGNLKKLRITENAATGEDELQDATGLNAIDVDGRIKREALTFWTDAASLDPPEDDEVAGKDGRSVPRGGAGQNLPGFLSGSPQQLNTEVGARQLYAEDSSALNGLMNLDADAATAAALWTEITAEWNPPPSSGTYGGASPAEQDRAVNILRHARGLLDDGTTVREWLLADPLHSRPLPINYGPRAPGYDADNPDIRVFMGSNDGFLRMFRNTDTGGAQDGAERWAFMPRAVVPKLDRLRSNTAGSTPVHPITVDGSPVAYTLDSNIDGALKSADGDKVYVYFGLRRGGKSYYGLDVSDPDSPELMWSIEKGPVGGDFAELAQSWSTPAVGHLKVNGTVLPVLVFAGGYNGDDGGDDLGDLGKDAKNRATRADTTPSPGTDDDEGNAIFVVNAEDGSLIWKATKGGSAGYDSVDKAYRHPEMHDSIAANVAAVDTDGDGLLDRVYAADTGGVVWRVDFAGLADHDSDATTPKILVNDDPSIWTVNRLFSAGRHVSGFSDLANDRRFFNRPDVVQSRDDVGPFDGVILGSGDREDPLGDEVEHWFYMIKDRAILSGNPPTTTLEHGDLADLTDNCLQDGSCGTDPDLTNGWRIRLGADGEKSLANAVTAGGTVFFTSFAPTPSSGTCSLSEGTGRLYAVNLQDATAVFNFDTTNDDATGTPTLERVDVLASGGIPVDIVPLGEGHVLVQGQEAGENIMTTSGRTSFKTYWHELYE